MVWSALRSSDPRGLKVNSNATKTQSKRSIVNLLGKVTRTKARIKAVL